MCISETRLRLGVPYFWIFDLLLPCFLIKFNFLHNPAALRYDRFRYLCALVPSPRPSAPEKASHIKPKLIKLWAAKLRDSTKVNRRYSENTDASPANDSLSAVASSHASRSKMESARKLFWLIHTGSLSLQLQKLLPLSSPKQSEIRPLCSRGGPRFNRPMGILGLPLPLCRSSSKTGNTPEFTNSEALRRKWQNPNTHRPPPEQVKPQAKRKGWRGAKFICKAVRKPPIGEGLGGGRKSSSLRKASRAEASV